MIQIYNELRAINKFSGDRLDDHVGPAAVARVRLLPDGLFQQALGDGRRFVQVLVPLRFYGGHFAHHTQPQQPIEERADLFRDATSRGVGAAPPGGESREPRPTMIFLFQHPERREWRENTATYGLYEWGSSGFAAAYGISLSRESRDRLYPPLRPIN